MSNLLMVTDQMVPWNGTCKVVSHLSSTLVERGYSVTIATARAETDSEWIPPEIPVELLEGNAYRNASRLGKIVRRDGIDLIHSHDNLGLGAVTLGVPHVTTSHSNWPRSWLMSGKHFAAGVLKELPHEVLLHVADEVVSVSDYSKRAMERRRISSEKVYNGVRTPLEIDGDRNEILFVGTLGPRKAKFLPQIWDVVTDRTDELSLDVVGKPSNRRITTEMKRLKHCTVHGKVDDITHYYETADVLLFPSRAEACPLSVLEAQSHGLQVVAFDICSNRELIAEGRTGYLVDPYDVEAFADLVIAAAEIAPANRDAAHGWIESNFSVDDMVAEYSRIYTSMT